MEKFRFRFLLIFLCLVVLSLLATLYLVASMDHIFAFPEISISDAYVRDPTRAVAAYLIPLGAFVFTLIVVSRLLRMFPYVYRQADLWMFSLVILATGFFLISACGVGAVPLSTQYSIHIVATVTLFISGGIIILTCTFLDSQLDFDQPQNLGIYRIILSSLVVFCGIALAITAQLADADAAAGIIEISLVVLFLMYFVSWGHDSEFPLNSKSLPSRLTYSHDICLPPV